jgi:hypothetical protein
LKSKNICPRLAFNLRAINILVQCGSKIGSTRGQNRFWNLWQWLITPPITCFRPAVFRAYPSATYLSVCYPTILLALRNSSTDVQDRCTQNLVWARAQFCRLVMPSAVFGNCFYTKIKWTTPIGKVIKFRNTTYV